MVAESPIGEAQTALLAVRQMRALMGCEGWPAMLSHLVTQQERLMAKILDDDTISAEQRELARSEYKVYRDLLKWPRETLDAQLSVLERSRTSERDEVLP